MRSGFVAVAGRPNVGKSTLVNALAGGKVAIVSDKPQTTRRRITGVANGEDHQLVLVDLPGFQRPLDPMTERMQRTVDQAFEDVDAVLFVLSARERIGAGDRFIAQRVFSLGVPVVIALNKVDRLKPGHIATQMDTASKLGDFHALHPVSAKTGDGIDALRDELVELLPEGPAYFPPDQRSDLSIEVQVAELVREKALALTREELPHAISVEVEELDEAPGGAQGVLTEIELEAAGHVLEVREGRLALPAVGHEPPRHRHLRAVVAPGVVVGRHRGGGREGPPEGVPERLDAGGAQLVELGAARLFHERAGLVAHAALPPVLFR